MFWSNREYKRNRLFENYKYVVQGYVDISVRLLYKDMQPLGCIKTSPWSCTIYEHTLKMDQFLTFLNINFSMVGG